MKKSRFLLVMSTISIMSLTSCLDIFDYPTSGQIISSSSTITTTSESTTTTSEITSEPTSLPTSETSTPVSSSSSIPNPSSSITSTSEPTSSTTEQTSISTLEPTSVPTSAPSSSPTSEHTSSNTHQTKTTSEEPSSTSVSTSEITSEPTSLTTYTSEAISSSSSEPIDDYEVIETFSKRMPAEFEPVSMVKMCYPNNMPLSVYKTIAEDNKILVLVNPNNQNKSRISEATTAFKNADVNMDNVTFIDMNIDEDYTYWVRDFSPFYVFNNYDLSVVDFTYNRPARTEQNAVPAKLATYFDIPYSKMNLTHTGGNLMQDGRGTAFSDDLVIYENSNNKTKVLNQMEQYTGTDNYVITIDPQGDYIAHIDCWAKIVSPDKIVVARLPKTDSRYDEYEEVANELASLKCIYGYNYKIYRIDEPGGKIIAPYTNSLIVNNRVYMPLGENSTYNKKALEVYKEALPGFEVIGIEGYEFSNQNSFLNTDALHCRTHEVPDQNMLFIDSRDVYNSLVDYQDEYLIKTNIVSYAKADVIDENVKIHYSINDGEYLTTTMNRYKDTTNFTFKFTNLKSGDDVKYYIDAVDANLNYNVDPICANLDPHHFVVK